MPRVQSFRLHRVPVQESNENPAFQTDGLMPIGSYRSKTLFYWSWSYTKTILNEAKNQALLGQTGLKSLVVYKLLVA